MGLHVLVDENCTGSSSTVHASQYLQVKSGGVRTVARLYVRRLAQCPRRSVLPTCCMAERLLAKTVRHAGQALVGVRREATTCMSCLALSCALSCLCVGKAAAHCWHVYLQHDVGDLCSSKPKSAGSWVCGIRLDISCASMVVGSPAMKSCFRSASSNTLKKRYWTLAITVSMCSPALRHTCMSCTNQTAWPTQRPPP